MPTPSISNKLKSLSGFFAVFEILNLNYYMVKRNFEDSTEPVGSSEMANPSKSGVSGVGGSGINRLIQDQLHSKTSQAQSYKSPRYSPSKSPKKLIIGSKLDQDWLRPKPEITDLVFQQFEVIDQSDIIKIFGITEQGNSVLVKCRFH